MEARAEQERSPAELLLEKVSAVRERLGIKKGQTIIRDPRWKPGSTAGNMPDGTLFKEGNVKAGERSTAQIDPNNTKLETVILNEAFNIHLLRSRVHDQRENKPEFARNDKIFNELNDRFELWVYTEAHIDDFLDMAERYAIHWKTYGDELPKDARNAEWEKKLSAALDMLDNNGTNVALGNKIVYTRQLIEAHEKMAFRAILFNVDDRVITRTVKDRISERLEALTFDDAGKQLMEDYLDTLVNKGSLSATNRAKISEAMHKTAKADARVVQFQGKLDAMMAKLPEQPVTTTDIISDANVNDYIEMYQKRFGQDLHLPKGQTHEARAHAMNQLAAFLMTRYSKMGMKVELQHDGEEKAWKLIKTFSLKKTNESPTSSLHIELVKEATNEWERRLREALSVTANYQVKRDANENDPERKLKLSHVMYSEMLKKHAEALFDQMFPKKVNGKRTPVKPEVLRKVLDLDSKVAALCEDYGEYSLSTNARFLNLLISEGALGPYYRAEQGHKMKELDESEKQPVERDSLDFRLKAMLTEARNMHSASLEQYLQLIEADTVPRLQNLTAIEDMVIRLDGVLEVFDSLYIDLDSLIWYVPGKVRQGVQAVSGVDVYDQIPGGEDLKKLDSFFGLREQAKELRGKLEGARTAIRKSKDQLAATKNDILRYKTEVMDIMKTHSPKTLKWDHPQDRPMKEKYLKALENLDAAQKKYSEQIRTLHQDVTTMLHFNAIKSSEHQNAANLEGHLLASIVAAVAQWELLRFAPKVVGAVAGRAWKAAPSAVGLAIRTAANIAGNVIGTGVYWVGEVLGRTPDEVKIPFTRQDIMKVLGKVDMSRPQLAASQLNLLLEQLEQMNPEGDERNALMALTEEKGRVVLAALAMVDTSKALRAKEETEFSTAAHNVRCRVTEKTINFSGNDAGKPWTIVVVEESGLVVCNPEDAGTYEHFTALTAAMREWLGIPDEEQEQQGTDATA